MFDLFSGEVPVFGTRAVGHAEVRVDPLEVDGGALVQDVHDVVHVFGRNTHPVHAGVDLDVDAVSPTEGVGVRDGRVRAVDGADGQRE